jgi:hypothetical protein
MEDLRTRSTPVADQFAIGERATAYDNRAGLRESVTLGQRVCCVLVESLCAPLVRPLISSRRPGYGRPAAHCYFDTLSWGYR